MQLDDDTEGEINIFLIEHRDSNPVAETLWTQWVESHRAFETLTEQTFEACGAAAPEALALVQRAILATHATIVPAGLDPDAITAARLNVLRDALGAIDGLAVDDEAKAELTDEWLLAIASEWAPDETVDSLMSPYAWWDVD